MGYSFDSLKKSLKYIISCYIILNNVTNNNIEHDPHHLHCTLLVIVNVFIMILI